MFGGLGAGVGGAISFTALYGLGTVGLSGAGIMSGLAAAGGIVDAGAAAGIFVLAAPVAVLAGTGVAISKNLNHKQLMQERKLFENKYGADEIQKLANSYNAKVPYDLQHNILNAENMVDVQIKGLSPQYHRLLSLGHDPFLSFIIGVLDIMNGTITTIDKKGKFVRQVVKYKDLSKRIETDYIQAILKQISHLKTDVATEMGLPAPLMGLFNFLDLGELEYVMNGGNGKGTIAEIIQQMYYNGFDFIHFCSQSISVSVLEIFVRVAYSIKRVKEGFSLKESIPELPPLKINREKHPKIATMLFLSHSGAVAINSGKICFTKNPLSINYAEWMAFALYSFNQLKWVLIDKPMLRGNYVKGILNKEFDEAFIDIDAFVKNYSSSSIS